MNDPVKRVIIVGGGLSGLACAVRLGEAGVPVSVIEGSDAIGGRVRTDVVEGFLLDRGFQVFLDAYPEGGALLDKQGLNLHAFRPGALVFDQGRLRRVMDVFREPWHLITSALAPIGSVADKIRVALLKWRLSRVSVEEIADHEDVTTERYLKQVGFSAGMIDGFFRAFYGGIFLERDLRTSSRMFEFTFKMFSKGSATLPAGGMGEIPRQLAARLPAGTVRLGTRATHCTATKVTLESGEQLEAAAVVLATDATTADRLLRGHGGMEKNWRSVTCLYFAAKRSPLGEAIIALNGSGLGLVNNVCVPSDVAPSYAPSGYSLVSVSVLGLPEAEGLESKVLEELETWFGKAVNDWRHLRTQRIEKALPEQAPQTSFTGRGYSVEQGVYVCGDHQWSASIEGAIISGKRTAEALVKSL
jgi:phytoene dehydrogenase-like protein